MVKKLSNEQLTRLALHSAGISNVLMEAYLASDEPDTEPEVITGESIEILVMEPGGKGKTITNEEPEPLNLNALVGEWRGGKPNPCLLIFKAAPGYMAALCRKKPKQGEEGSCYLIHRVGDNLCFNSPSGMVCLTHDREADVITLYPGGSYSRVPEAKK